MIYDHVARLQLVLPGLPRLRGAASADAKPRGVGEGEAGIGEAGCCRELDVALRARRVPDEDAQQREAGAAEAVAGGPSARPRGNGSVRLGKSAAATTRCQ